MTRAKVSNNILNMLVRRLANQMPVRYYLHWNYPNQPYQCALELYRQDIKGNQDYDSLRADLEKYGFELVDVQTNCGFLVQRWIAERDLDV